MVIIESDDFYEDLKNLQNAIKEIINGSRKQRENNSDR